MTAPDPRLDEIQAIPAEAIEAAARIMAPTAWGPQVWHFMTHGETPTGARDRVQRQSLEDARKALEAAHPVLLAELRNAHEALAAVSAIEEVLDGWDALVPFRDAEESQRWYSLGKRHAAEHIRTVIAEARAAVAAANGDGE